MASPPRMIAPPMPTTTPMTVALVLGDILLEDEEELSELREAAPVALMMVEEVDDDTVVNTLPETVMTFVTSTTLTDVDSDSVMELCEVDFAFWVGEVVVFCCCVCEVDVGWFGDDVDVGVVVGWTAVVVTLVVGIVGVEVTGVDVEIIGLVVAGPVVGEFDVVPPFPLLLDAAAATRLF
jgi:hypothetical protein